MERNPLRVLDCKEKGCKDILRDAPVPLDILDDDCREHFEQVKCCLDTMGIEYEINSHIVRGLDYYTRTVFEFISTDIGAQGTICGGGRYDGLVAECGGEPTPGIGFAIGLERTMIALEKQGILPKTDTSVQVFVAPIAEGAREAAFKLVYELRQNNIIADMDHMGRSLKSQMRYANKYPAKYVAVIGEDELKSGQVTIKNMATGEQQTTDAAQLMTIFSKGQEDL
jgi:histidyl-tRNA synthetase